LTGRTKRILESHASIPVEIQQRSSFVLGLDHPVMEETPLLVEATSVVAFALQED
jgi:hypothetical protein